MICGQAVLGNSSDEQSTTHPHEPSQLVPTCPAPPPHRFHPLLFGVLVLRQNISYPPIPRPRFVAPALVTIPPPLPRHRRGHGHFGAHRHGRRRNGAI